MAFFENDSIILYGLSIFVNTCYLIDIVISMFTAYYSKHLILIDDLCLIVKNYILTWFLIDLLTTFPFDLLP